MELIILNESKHYIVVYFFSFLLEKREILQRKFLLNYSDK